MRRLVAGLVLAAMMLWTVQPAEAASKKELQATLTVAFMRAADRSPFPYVIRQHEFQGSWWILGIEDPIPRSARMREIPATTDVMFTWPLRMYRDAVRPHLAQLGFVKNYILAFRDTCQTVYEIKPSDLKAFAAGKINVDRMVARLGISALTGC